MQSQAAATHLLASSQRPLPRDDHHTIVNAKLMAKGPIYMLQASTWERPARHSHSAVRQTGSSGKAAKLSKRRAQLLKGANRMSQQSISSLSTMSSNKVTNFVKMQRNMILSSCEPSLRKSIAPRLRAVSIADSTPTEPTGPARHVRPTSPALQAMEADATYDAPGPSLDAGRPRTAAQLRSSLAQTGASIMSMSPASPYPRGSNDSASDDEWFELNQSLNAGLGVAPRTPRRFSPLDSDSLRITRQVVPSLSPIVPIPDSQSAARSLQTALAVTSVMECLPPPPSVHIKARPSSRHGRRHTSSPWEYGSARQSLSAVRHEQWGASPQLTVFGTADLS